MSPPLQDLEVYLADCESKRRRARSRPSNQVIEELRVLFDAYLAATGGRPGAERSGASDSDSDQAQEPNARPN